jgi:hypothetical protein
MAVQATGRCLSRHTSGCVDRHAETRALRHRRLVGLDGQRRGENRAGEVLRPVESRRTSQVTGRKQQQARSQREVGIGQAAGKEQHPVLPAVWIAGYSNDYAGYTTSRRGAIEGGYEVQNDFTLTWKTASSPKRMSC